MKTSKLLEARENANDRVAMVFSLHFISCEDDASFPITEQSKVKPMQSRITFDTRLKNDPYQYKKTKKNAYLIVSSTGNHKPKTLSLPD